MVEDVRRVGVGRAPGRGVGGNAHPAAVDHAEGERRGGWPTRQVRLGGTNRPLLPLQSREALLAHLDLERQGKRPPGHEA